MTIDQTPENRPAAIVTGAGSGIGRATALALHKAGYRVALVGRTASKLTETGAQLGARGTDWEAVPADVSYAPAARRIVSRVVSLWGRLDALVNNAGSTPLTPLAQADDREILEVFQLNAIGPIASTVEAIPHLLDSASRGGPAVVVNVSSMASGDPFPGLGVYGCAKASVNTLARAVATEHGEAGLRAFSVAPGAVETPLLRSMFDASAIPSESTLAPEDVTEHIMHCVNGTTTEANGATIWVPSP
ncbi:MAG: SDR family oxidoreductase [Planctomycetota bacterium]